MTRYLGTMAAVAAVVLFAGTAYAEGGGKPPAGGPVYNGGGGGSAVQGQAQGQLQGQAQGQSLRNNNTATGGSATNASTSRGGDQSQGQQTNVDNRGAGSNSNNYQQSGIPVSSAVAPSFAIGGCQWAASGGIQFFGTGVSGGGAGMYEFCKGLMKAKHFREVSNNDVAKSLECQDASIRAAYKEAGQPCAADMPRGSVQQSTQATPQRAGYIGPNGFTPYPAGYRPGN